jgi:predicted dehydrogenase
MSRQDHTTRREFATTSALAGASLLLAKPSLVRGSEANSRLKAGMIGLGGRGSLIGKMLVDHPGFELVAACDYFKEVVDEKGAELGVPESHRFHTLSGYKGLVDSDLDAVFFEAPPYAFPDQVAYGVDAGRHIYLAKPVASDVPGCLQVRAAADKAQKNGQTFLIDFQMRTEPNIIETVARVRSGDLGKLGLIVVASGSNGFEDPPMEWSIESRLRNLTWVNDTELGCGYLGNYDIHAVDAALWLAGELPTDAMGVSRRVRPNPNGDSHDAYSVTCRFRGGFVLNLHSEHYRDTGGKLDAYAHGTEGHAETRYWGKSWVHSNRRSFRGGETGSLYVDGIQRNLDAFHAAVIAGDTRNPTVKPSIDSTLASILMRDAAEREGLLTWEEMLEENRRREVDLTGLAV